MPDRPFACPPILAHGWPLDQIMARFTGADADPAGHHSRYPACPFIDIGGLAANATIDPGRGLLIALRMGFVLGLMALMWYGGIEVLYHAVLRFLLRREGPIPARYPDFLDYAVDLIFLRRVGGSYIFIHQLLLQDHFALGYGQEE